MILVTRVGGQDPTHDEIPRCAPSVEMHLTNWYSWNDPKSGRWGTHWQRLQNTNESAQLSQTLQSALGYPALLQAWWYGTAPWLQTPHESACAVP